MVSGADILFIFFFVERTTKNDTCTYADAVNSKVDAKKKTVNKL